MKRFPFLHRVLHLLVVVFGQDLIDEDTGEKVARALMFCWRGRVHLFGLEGHDQVMPIFLPQPRLAFWKRQIGFRAHPRPDFDRLAPPETATAPPSAVCFLLLSHQAPEDVARLTARWREYCPAPSQLLLAYGGTRENFARIAYEPKFYADDPRLRTREHQREKQSYTQVFQRTAAWLEQHPECGYVYLAEYDHWPLVPDLGARLIERLRDEDADMLGHQLYRRDRTSCVYYQDHVVDPRFLPWLRGISRRSDQEAGFNMLGTGSFWSRAAFLAVAREEEAVPSYLEIYLPTVAHHLGFRVRDFQDQNRFIWADGDRGGQVEAAGTAGAWTIHPIKSWPASSPSAPPARATGSPP